MKNTVVYMNQVCLPACITALLCIAKVAWPQPQFLQAGRVEYEKTTNMHKLMGNDTWSQERKKVLPVYRKLYFDLVFTPEATLYRPGREPAEDKYRGWGDVTSANISYADLVAGKLIQQKQVFEDRFLITDSLLDIEWKLTPDTRTIAGFECRKAVGRFRDSLYVVAFYSDEILPPGGPEGFAGLPGLILGLAFPRIHTTWFATKVEPALREAGPIKPPTAGKKTSRQDMLQTVDKAVARWDDEENRNLLRWQLVW